MIDGLKPYPKMKDSGVPWLRKVPEHWAVKRNKLFMREVNERSEDGSEELLTVSQYTGVTRRRERLSDEGDLLTNATSLIGYKRVMPGDLVMNIMLAWNGSLGVSGVDGIASPAYCVFRAKDGIDPRFLHYLLRTPSFTGVFKTVSTGVVDSRLRLYPDVFLCLPSLVPPFPEQSAIVRFLEYVDRRIQRYIRAKQKLIKLLEEQKQAIIQRAVTHGLDPNVRLKPSGVEWLGDVPEHWSITRLKFVAIEIVDCLHATPTYSEGGAYPAIRTADVVPGQLLLEKARRVGEEHYRKWTARMTPAEGDILYTREGERFGIAALVPAQVDLCISQRMMAFRIDSKHNGSYVMWQINCQHVYAQAAADLIGAAAPHVNVERIKNFWLAIPPRREQDEIAAAIEKDIEVPGAAIQRAQDEIRLLREYRTRLIADVVTGQLDVREAAAQLPVETEEPEPLDDADALAEGNEEAEAADFDAATEEADA